MHSLNAYLGGPHFRPETFYAFCDAFDALIDEDGHTSRRDFIVHDQLNMISYAVTTLGAALGDIPVYYPIDRPSPDMRPATLARRRITAVFVFNRSHVWCVRFHAPTSTWYNLDSMKRPRPVCPTAFAAKSLGHVLCVSPP